VSGSKRASLGTGSACSLLRRPSSRAPQTAPLRNRWEEWRRAGIGATHGGEAAQKRGETVARINNPSPKQPKVTETGRTAVGITPRGRTLPGPERITQGAAAAFFFW
jgi:hypothetical protein